MFHCTPTHFGLHTYCILICQVVHPKFYDIYLERKLSVRRFHLLIADWRTWNICSEVGVCMAPHFIFHYGIVFRYGFVWKDLENNMSQAFNMWSVRACCWLFSKEHLSEKWKICIWCLFRTPSFISNILVPS